MADMIEVAKATVTIIPNMEGSQATIAKELGAATEPAANSAGKKAGSSFASSMGGAISAGAGVVVGATAAITGAAVGAGKAIWDNANRVAEFGDNIDKTSQKIGISAEAFQEWDYVFNRSGADINKLQTGMKTLSGVITDATAGSEGAVNKLSAVGISIEEIGNLSQEDQLALVISRLQEMGSGAERTAAASDLLGKSAVDMAAVLNMSASDTQALIDEAHEYGMVLSDEGVAASAAFEDSLLKMSNTAAGVGNSIMASLMPSLTQMMDGMSDLIAGKEGGASAIAEGLTNMLSGITSAVPAIMEAFTAIIEALLPEIPGMLQQIMDTVIQVLPQLLTSLTGLLPDLIAGIANLIVMVASHLSEIIMPLVDAIPTIIPALISGLITALPAIIQGLLTLVTNIVAQLPTIIQALVDAIPTIIEQLVPALIACTPQLIMGAVQLVVALVAALPQIIQSLLMAIPTVIEALINAVATAWPGFIEAVKGFFTETIPAVVEWGLDVQNKAREAIVGLVTKVGTALGQLPGKIKSALAKAITAVVSWGTSMTMKGNAIANKLVTTIVTKVKELPGKMLDIGKNIVEGLWNGIKGMTSWLTDKLKEWCNGAIDTIKGFFGIESPSRVMRDEVGKMLVEGMAQGITKNTNVITGAMQKAGEMMTTAFDANVNLVGDAPMSGVQSNTFNNTITVNGAQDPEAWTRGFVRTLNRQARAAMG